MNTASHNNQTALITGASSGIGLELARLCAADGFGLILVARRVDVLNQLADELQNKHGIPVTIMPKDLSQPHAAQALWQDIASTGLEVNVLINNAGIGTLGPFALTEAAATETMLELNVVALTMLTRLALESMLKRGAGKILNVASLAGFQPGGPGMAAYYATKSYVLSLTRALAVELRGSGVTVTALCPGPTHTEFEGHAPGMQDTPLFRWVPVMSAREVAEAGYRGMHNGSAAVIPGFINKLLALGGELPPRRIALEVNRFLLQP